ncbi:MAG: hypothetical protein P1P88_10370 [Bacteroidales bacterium]|nr:hypothetical protein [Bacteroidales bacterium]
MERKVINFKKARDFGDLLSDTFEFLKIEFKPLMKVLLTYVGPFLLITGLVSGWYQSEVFGGMFDFKSNDPQEVFNKIFDYRYFILIIGSLCSYVFMIGGVYSYIDLYIHKGPDEFSPEDVWKLMLQKFFPILGAMILVGLIVGVGFIFCIAPGIYLFVIFSLVVPAIVFGNMGVGQGMERSTSLVKDYFWFTLGVGFVSSLIAGFGSYIFIIPQMVLSMFFTFTSASGGDMGMSSTYSVLLTISTVIATFGSSLLYCIPYTTMAMHYHSQVEKKESPNLINKINQINQPNEKEDSGFGF